MGSSICPTSSAAIPAAAFAATKAATSDRRMDRRYLASARSDRNFIAAKLASSLVGAVPVVGREQNFAATPPTLPAC